jgi:ubiquinol-cytochrome c reductase iron-sulfur subunit
MHNGLTELPMTDRPLTADDQRRRLRLRVAAKLMVGFGVLCLAYVLIAQVFSGGGETPSMPTLRVAVADLQPGESRIVSWEDRPVLLYRRLDEDFSQLRSADERLLDATSRQSQQPESYRGDFRSSSPELFVAIALGTDLGCPVSFLPPQRADFQGKPWAGGFIDSCRKGRYDLAGRVYRSQYADRNLVVPRYVLEGDTLILGR